MQDVSTKHRDLSSVGTEKEMVRFEPCLPKIMLSLTGPVVGFGCIPGPRDRVEVTCSQFGPIPRD